MKHEPTYIAECDNCHKKVECSVGWDYGGMEQDLPDGWIEDRGADKEWCDECHHCDTKSDTTLEFIDEPLTFEKSKARDEHTAAVLAAERLYEEEAERRRSRGIQEFSGLMAWIPVSK